MSRLRTNGATMIRITPATHSINGHVFIALCVNHQLVIVAGCGHIAGNAGTEQTCHILPVSGCQGTTYPSSDPRSLAGLSLVMADRPMGDKQSSPSVTTKYASVNTSSDTMPSMVAKNLVPKNI